MARWFLVGCVAGTAPWAWARSVYCPTDWMALRAAEVRVDGVVVDDASLTEVDRWSGELRLEGTSEGPTLTGPRLGTLRLEVGR